MKVADVLTRGAQLLAYADVSFNKQQNIVRFLTEHGLSIVEKGFVGCPIWPDSLGFRDKRLHRQNISFDGSQRESQYIDSLASGQTTSMPLLKRQYPQK